MCACVCACGRLDAPVLGVFDDLGRRRPVTHQEYAGNGGWVVDGGPSFACILRGVLEKVIQFFFSILLDGFDNHLLHAYTCHTHTPTMGPHPSNKPATRHIVMRKHFCRQHVELGNVTTYFKKTADMLADFLSKQTPKPTHDVTVIILLEINQP